MPVDSTKMMTYNRIMISLNINEIKTHFSGLYASVSKGETVIVCKGNVPMAEIAPISALPNERRPIGLAAKEYPDFEIGDAFFDRILVCQAVEHSLTIFTPDPLITQYPIRSLWQSLKGIIPGDPDISESIMVFRAKDKK